MLPAYAGMIRRGRAEAYGAGGAPRVCGDDPVGDWETLGKIKCSPRMRG